MAAVINQVACTSQLDSCLRCSTHREDVGVVCREDTKVQSRGARHVSSTHACKWLGPSMHRHSVLVYAVKLRLVNGDPLAPGRSGRLEINYNNQWGTASATTPSRQCACITAAAHACVPSLLLFKLSATKKNDPDAQVCADGFDENAGTVACRQMDLPTPARVLPPGQYGAGTGPIFLDDVQCTGSEAGLQACKSRGWGVHNCRHTQDVALFCGSAYTPGDKPAAA